jgi:hypothetical protein
MTQKRPRIKTGRLVASTNHLKNIQSKRLDIIVKYVSKAFNNTIISQEIIGIREAF